MTKQPCVYILANQRNGTLYIGVTTDLIKRVWEHKHDLVQGFTNRYKIHKLVWYEQHDNLYSAISREKELKNWRREWKRQLIEGMNPYWTDLYESLLK